ncbi:calcium release-activated calcium channel protein 1-like [Ctenocephalides felis]|uniref:calcium release-activated calcium channel protein 1-like n=1 Tax=Ctenocephalides felis TaxID=7515 RepID=UPI000E6E26AA|nr:calcium release-activated calcium channel protein 1-like [Ctenocephalides felis]
MPRADISCSDSWASSVSSSWDRSYQHIRTNVSSSALHLHGSPPPSYQPPPSIYSINPGNSLNFSCKDRGQQEMSPDSPTWRQLHMCRAKLKATSTTSELLSGFAMIAMVELQVSKVRNTPGHSGLIKHRAVSRDQNDLVLEWMSGLHQVNDHSRAPQWLLVCFAVTTTILVSVHIFALMVSTYVLPHLDLATKLSNESALTDCPHYKLKSYIDLAWVLSTFLGLILFLMEIAILCWVKFWDFSRKAAASATAIVMPVLLVFLAFALYYHWSLVIARCCAWNKHKRKPKQNNPV